MAIDDKVISPIDVIDSFEIGSGRLWRSRWLEGWARRGLEGFHLHQTVPRQAVVEDLQVGMILEVAGLMPRLKVE